MLNEENTKRDIEIFDKATTEIVIETNDDYEKAGELMKNVNKSYKELIERKEEIIKPIQASMKSTRELFEPFEKQFAKIVANLKSAMLDYKRREDEKARIEKERVMARVERGTMREDTAISKIENLNEVAKSGDGFSVRKVKKVRIINESLIPREFLIPNMVKISTTLLKEGGEVPGCEIYVDEIMAVKS